MVSGTGWLDDVGWIPFVATPLASVPAPTGVTWTTSPQSPWLGASWPDADGAGSLRPPAAPPAPQDSWIEAAFAGPAEVEFLTLPHAWPPGEWKRSVLYVPGNSFRWNASTILALDGLVVRPEIPLSEALDGPGIVWTRTHGNFYGTTADSFDGVDAARLELMPDGQSRSGALRATFDGPAWFSIKAKTTGTAWPAIQTESGAAGVWSDIGNGWKIYRVPVAPGSGRSVTIADISPPDVLLDEAAVEPIAANTIADGLEAPDFLWTTGGHAPWGYSPIPGNLSSDTVGVCTDSPGTSWLETIVTGPGTVTFSWRGTESLTSYAASTSLLIDGATAASFLHEQPTYAEWRTVEVAIPAGSHTLRWQTIVVAAGRDSCTELDGFGFRQENPIHAGAEAEGLVLVPAVAGMAWTLETADTADGADALRFPTVLPWFEGRLLSTNLKGPGRLRFSWKAPAGSTGSAMVFGVLTSGYPISGVSALQGEWRDEDVPVPPGQWTVGWGGTAPASGLLDRISWTADVPATLAEALDAPGIEWSTDAGSPWVGWESPGTDDDYAAPAPDLRTVPGAPMVLTGSVMGPGELAFTWRSSSPIGYAISFSTGGFPIYSSEQRRTVRLPMRAGAHILRWAFTANTPEGAVLDDVSFTPWQAVSAGEATETGDRVWVTDPNGAMAGLSGSRGGGRRCPPRRARGWIMGADNGLRPRLARFLFHPPSALAEQWTVTVNDVAVDLPEPVWPGIFVANEGVHTVRWTYRTTTPASVTPFGLDDVSWTQGDSPDLASAVDWPLVLTTSELNPWKGTSVWSHDGSDAACSVGLGSGQNSSMQTVVTGPATVTFFWRLAYHRPLHTPSLVLRLDGAEALRATPGTDVNRFDWQRVSVSLGAGEHSLEWQHTGSYCYAAPMAPAVPNPNSGAWVDGLTVSDGPGLAGALDYIGPGIAFTEDLAIITGWQRRATALTPCWSGRRRIHRPASRARVARFLVERQPEFP